MRSTRVMAGERARHHGSTEKARCVRVNFVTPRCHLSGSYRSAVGYDPFRYIFTRQVRRLASCCCDAPPSACVAARRTRCRWVCACAWCRLGKPRTPSGAAGGLGRDASSDLSWNLPRCLRNDCGTIVAARGNTNGRRRAILRRVPWVRFDRRGGHARGVGPAGNCSIGPRPDAEPESASDTGDRAKSVGDRRVQLSAGAAIGAAVSVLDRQSRRCGRRDTVGGIRASHLDRHRPSQFHSEFDRGGRRRDPRRG